MVDSLFTIPIPPMGRGSMSARLESIRSFSGRISREHRGILLLLLTSLRCKTEFLPIIAGFAKTNIVNRVTFILSALLVFKDDRANKVSGGTSYA